MLHVTDFLHYLYVPAPVSFNKTDCEPFKAYLDNQFAQNEPIIASVQMVIRESIYGFHGNRKSPYLKISVTDPKSIGRLRSMIEAGDANWRGMWRINETGLVTFDNLQYVLRFMVDTKVGKPVP